MSAVVVTPETGPIDSSRAPIRGALPTQNLLQLHDSRIGADAVDGGSHDLLDVILLEDIVGEGAARGRGTSGSIFFLLLEYIVESNRGLRHVVELATRSCSGGGLREREG